MSDVTNEFPATNFPGTPVDPATVIQDTLPDPVPVYDGNTCSADAPVDAVEVAPNVDYDQDVLVRSDGTEVGVLAGGPIVDLTDATGAAAVTAAADEAKSDRGPRTPLEQDLFAVCNNLSAGRLVLEADTKPSPHILAREVHKYRNEKASASGEANPYNAPSSGAISAALTRWAEVGFIVLDSNPTAFAGFTQEGLDSSLTEMKAKHKAQVKAAKAAAKEVAAAPAPQVQPDVITAPAVVDVVTVEDGAVVATDLEVEAPQAYVEVPVTE